MPTSQPASQLWTTAQDWAAAQGLQLGALRRPSPWGTSVPGTRADGLPVTLLLGRRFDPWGVESEREVLQLLAANRRPHVLPILGWACFGSNSYQCVSFHETATADFRTLLEQQSVSPALAAQAAWHTARALAHLHELAVVHRQLAPENIFLFCGCNTIVKVGGFQEAILCKSGVQKMPLCCSNIPHKAPEQWLQAVGGGENYGLPADLWSFGWTPKA